MKSLLRNLILLSTFLMLMGCGLIQSADDESSDVPERPYAIEGELLAGPTVLNWVDSAVDDLVEETGTNIEDVVFTQFEIMVWPDQFYGCPSHFDAEEMLEDEEFEPIPKEGYRVVLQAEGEDFFYHGGEEIEQFLCQEP